MSQRARVFVPGKTFQHSTVTLGLIGPSLVIYEENEVLCIKVVCFYTEIAYSHWYTQHLVYRGQCYKTFFVRYSRIFVIS
jgi:hypothetical protein